MGSEDQILKALYKIAIQQPFEQVVEEFGREALAQVHFRELIREVDPTITITDCDRFFQQALIDFKSLIGLTPEILEKLTEEQEKVEFVLTKENVESIKIIVASYRAKKLSIERVFKFFDKNKDLALEEREIKEMLEFFHTKMKAQEYQSLRKQFGDLKFSCDHLKQLFSEWEKIADEAKKSGPQEEVKFTIRSQKDEQFQKEEHHDEPQKDDVEQQDTQEQEVDFTEFMNVDLNIPFAKELMQLRNDLRKKKEIFTDTEFPASVRSLGMKYCNLSWKRLSDIFPTGLRVFNVDDKQDSRVGLGKWISHKDIRQGILGDCYFLASISTVACRWPEVIKDLFITQRPNGQKLYAVKLCLDGEWQIVILDDFIPVTASGQPAFSKNAGPEMWVALLEKAWAKVNIDYTEIEGGDPREVIKSLTGGPTWRVFTNAADFKQQLQKCSDMKCVMSSGTFKENPNYAAYGLEGGHAYSLLKVYTVQHPQKGELTLLKIRNPWGRIEWNGDWSDASPLWTEELKQQVKFGKKEDDGIFFMEIKDFQRYFQAIFVGYFKKEYIYSSITQVAKKTKSYQYDVDIPSDGEYFFTIHQEAGRKFKQVKEFKYEYSYVRMILAKHLEQNKYEYIDMKLQSDMEVHLGGQLTKGKYSVQFKILWQIPNWSEHDYTFSIYGSEYIQPKQVPRNAELRYQCILQYARQNTKLQQITNGLLSSMEINAQKGFGYIYYKSSAQKQFKLKNTLTKKGVKLVKPEGGDSYIVTIAPGEEKVFLLSLDPKSEMAVQSKHSFAK